MLIPDDSLGYWIDIHHRCLGSLRKLAYVGLECDRRVLAAVVIGPLNASVPGRIYQCAWLFGALAVFALVCNYESGSEG
jgi:hypothetical protein